MKNFTHGQWLKLLHDRRFYATLLALVIDVAKVVFNWQMSPTDLALINGIIGVFIGGDTVVAVQHAKALAMVQAKPTLVPQPGTAMNPGSSDTNTTS